MDSSHTAIAESLQKQMPFQKTKEVQILAAEPPDDLGSVKLNFTHSGSPVLLSAG